MGTHTAPVNRAGSNASDTSVAIAFSWAISAGTGSNPVNAADFPNGTFPSGTGTIPAGSASATITFQSNPDTTFEQDETGILTLTTTQSGVTITGSPQPFTITNDDTGGSTGKTFGPTDGNSPAPFDTEVAANYVEFTFRPNIETIDFFVGGSASTISDTSGDSVMMRMSADNSWTAYKVRNGSMTQIGTPYTTAPTDGQKIRLRQNADQSVDLLFGGTPVKQYSAALAWPSADGKTPGTWGRLITTFSNGGSTKAVTIGPVA